MSKSPQEAILWSFSIRLDRQGNLVLVKRNIALDNLKKVNHGNNALPMAELTEVYDYLNEVLPVIEYNLEKITSRKAA